ncbi:MAG: hypothetical protein V3U76_09470 [Granulosicoccus sp.]
MDTADFTLKDDPDWHGAATELVVGLAQASDSEERIRLLEVLCQGLGDRLYPAFLQILSTIEQFADEASQAIVAQTLVDCLRSGRLPSGPLSAWGASSLPGDNAFGQLRRLGPIEYVCVWYEQPGNQMPLSQQQFTAVFGHLLSLVATHPPARELYSHKLLSDIDDPVGGSLSSQTRTALRDMIDCWTDSSSIDTAVEAYLNGLQSESLLHQLAKGPLDSIG